MASTTAAWGQAAFQAEGHVTDWATRWASKLGREMGFQVTVAGTGDQNKDQSGRPSGGIEQEQNFVVYLPTSVQVLEPSAVLASLPLIPAIPYLNSI